MIRIVPMCCSRLPWSCHRDAWESTLKGFKMDKEPRTPASGFGDGAYFLFTRARSAEQDNVGFLIATSGSHTLVLSLDARSGSPAESTRPALESLMKSVLARVR